MRDSFFRPDAACVRCCVGRVGAVGCAASPHCGDVDCACHARSCTSLPQRAPSRGAVLSAAGVQVALSATRHVRVGSCSSSRQLSGAALAADGDGEGSDGSDDSASSDDERDDGVRVVVPREKLEKQFSRSGGAGGQNVNKVNTKAEVRFVLDEVSRVRRRVCDATGGDVSCTGASLCRRTGWRQR